MLGRPAYRYARTSNGTRGRSSFLQQIRDLADTHRKSERDRAPVTAIVEAVVAVDEDGSHTDDRVVLGDACGKRLVANRQLGRCFAEDRQLMLDGRAEKDVVLGEALAVRELGDQERGVKNVAQVLVGPGPCTGTS